MANEWRGFIEESKSYMNHPDYWAEWTAALYMEDGSINPDYPGWTLADKRKATLKFWLAFPRACVRFHFGMWGDWLKWTVFGWFFKWWFARRFN